MSLNATIEYYLYCIRNITNKIGKSQKYAIWPQSIKKVIGKFIEKKK